ncbi:MAG: semialdehyde dehydrogenase [Planctomycetales bacterium]|nr:semialdehyde dehydrogenase [Planctomycetales bacterium]
MIKLAIFGAGGNMGTRASKTLVGDANYEVLHVETGEAGIKRLAETGLTPIPCDEALAQADTVLFALPDHLIGAIAQEIVPKMRPGTLVICLDPAAPYNEKLPRRDDIAYFVTHPSHPPIFNDETDPEVRRDFFGGGLAKQSIVSALMQGTDEDYAKGEAISRKLFGPILRSHRLTVEQMAILEPALAETLAATCLTIIRQGMDESIRRGVPAEAARDFLMGHLNIELAIIFNETDWNFSKGCQQAIQEAIPVLFKEDWKRIFEPEELRASVARITGG